MQIRNQQLTHSNSYNIFKKMEISAEEQTLAKQNLPKEEEEELITDFSMMFKGKGPIRRPSKKQVKPVEPTPNWLLQIPAKLQITKDQLCQRKVLDQRKWKSIVKCTSTNDRIIASVVSAWNYLYSLKGIGSLKPFSIKSAIQFCQKHNIKYLSQTEYDRAQIAINLFKELCKQTNTYSESQVIIKPTIPNKMQASQTVNLDYFLKGLTNQNNFYVFMTYNNIMCPIGFDKTPLVPLDAFKKLQQIKPENIELWIINASTQRFQPSFISKRWSDIRSNLTTQWPYYVDLDEPKKGPQLYQTACEENKTQMRGNSHCIIEFKRSTPAQSVEK